MCLVKTVLTSLRVLKFIKTVLGVLSSTNVEQMDLASS